MKIICEFRVAAGINCLEFYCKILIERMLFVPLHPVNSLALINWHPVTDWPEKSPNAKSVI